MILKNLLKKLIKFYQYFISPMLGNNCRYNPTCSEYAMWEIECDNFFKAVIKTVLRILRCNQLFRGGIDYPVIRKNIHPKYGIKKKVDFWLIPKGNNKFIIIKANNE